MCNMWNLVCLWRMGIILLICMIQVPTIKIETQFFQKVKALVSSRSLLKAGAVHKCESCVSLKISLPNREHYTDFSCAFGSSAMSSSFWASDTTHFTDTVSESEEAFWRVWKHTFTYGVIIHCGNIAPSCLFWNIPSPVFAQKALIPASVGILEMLCMGMLFTSLCRECFEYQHYRKWNPCRVNWVTRFGKVDV